MREFHKNQAVNLQTNTLEVGILLNKLFIVFALIFFSQKISAQSIFALPPSYHLTLQSDSTGLRPGSISVLQKDVYVKNLAFFCRQEWKLEKALRVPIRVRVGSLDQCNRLEGK